MLAGHRNREIQALRQEHRPDMELTSKIRGSGSYRSHTRICTGREGSLHQWSKMAAYHGG